MYPAEIVRGHRDGGGDAPKRAAQTEGALSGDSMGNDQLH